MKACENPLRVDRVERLLCFEPEWLGTEWGVIEERLERLDRRAAVVGPHGSGKTTFLDSLAPRLQERGFVVGRFRLGVGRGLNAAVRVALFAAMERGECILLDGAEQIGIVDWRRIRRAAAGAAGLVITSHRRGRLPVLLETSTTPETLERCVCKLLGAGAGQFSVEEIRRIWRRHRGNVREALWEMYDFV